MVLVNLDGKIVPPEEAVVSVFDRSFLFGDSVYETLRTYGGKPFAARAHLKRLRASMERLRIHMELQDAEIGRRIEETIAAAGNEESYVRVVVSRGVGAFGLGPGLDTPGAVYVIVRPFEPLSEDAFRKGISAMIPAVRRNPIESLDPALKTGNYLNNILAMIEAREAGADDAILLNLQGHVTEATTASVFVVIDGILATPPLHAGILHGITRGYLLEAAAEGGLTAIERDLDAEELREADEIFITSTLKEVLPVRTLDGNPLRTAAPGPITLQARSMLADRIRQAHAGAAA